ncbi:snrnp protein [Reticulomyxa filosa]|uniref:Snrnp protein n=1 Tax=Reticulomyxa filosa TaxID=46433 RepID=X6MYL8_RETFI|nr:snrnp protein [Reticulomyxa filosa]|eukprot:ETO18582.1 snrnp protein [Reticulomyxa filosa]
MTMSTSKSDSSMASFNSGECVDTTKVTLKNVCTREDRDKNVVTDYNYEGEEEEEEATRPRANANANQIENDNNDDNNNDVNNNDVNNNDVNNKSKKPKEKILPSLSERMTQRERERSQLWKELTKQWCVVASQESLSHERNGATEDQRTNRDNINENKQDKAKEKEKIKIKIRIKIRKIIIIMIMIMIMIMIKMMRN